MEWAVGKRRMGGVCKSLQFFPEATSPVSPQLQAEGNGRKGLSSLSKLLPYHFIGLPFYSMSSKLQISLLDQVESNGRWTEESILSQSNVLVLLWVFHFPGHILAQAHTLSINSSSTPSIQRQGENFFHGAKNTRLSLGGQSFKIIKHQKIKNVGCLPLP